LHVIIALLCPSSATSHIAVAAGAIISTTTATTTVATTTKVPHLDGCNPQDSNITLLEVPEA